MGLKTAIIGSGGIAYCHADALRKLGVEIAGVFDIIPESAAKLAAAYGGRAISSIDEILDEVDMIHLCTPPSCRLEYAEKAMAAGKHVLSEKPMATSVEDGEKLVALAKKYGVVLMVGFSHRYRHGFKILRDTYRSGVLGKMSSLFVHRYAKIGATPGLKTESWRTNPNLACGMTVESLSHDIDLILQINPGIATVQANVKATIDGLPQFDTNTNAIFTFNDGSLGLIDASWSSPLNYSSRGVIGDKGSAILIGNDIFGFTELHLRTLDMERTQVTLLNDPFRFVGCYSYYDENSHFIDCVVNGTPCEVSGEYALRTLKTSHAILEAAGTGSKITVDY